MLTVLKTQPTLILAAVRAVVVLATAFGLSLTAEQIAAVYVLTEAVLALVNHGMVTPNSKLAQ